MDLFTPADLSAEIVDAVSSKGWYFGNGLFGAALCNSLYYELLSISQHKQAFRKAKVGHKLDNTLDMSIRNSHINWIDTQNPSLIQKEYLDIIGKLMSVLKRELYLPMNSFEAHFAIYQSTGFYKKHVDSFHGVHSRLISIVLYLNEDWPENSGGELVIYNESNPTQIDFKGYPRMGSFAIFLSQKIFHEVLPTTRIRFSLSGWMRYHEIDKEPLAFLNH